MYLYGIDTRKGPNEYLHTNDNVVAAKRGGAADTEVAIPSLISIHR